MLFPGHPLHRHPSSWLIPNSACKVILWQHTWFSPTNPFWSLSVEISWDSYQLECLSMWVAGCNPSRMLLLPCSLCDSSPVCSSPVSDWRCLTSALLFHRGSRGSVLVKSGVSLAGLSGWPLAPFPAWVGTIPWAGLDFISLCVESSKDLKLFCRTAVCVRFLG